MMKTQIFPINHLTESQLQQLSEATKAGAVVAWATDTVYGLAADAFNEEAISRIYKLKGRPASMPLQILVDSVQSARPLAQWNDAALRLAEAYWPGALTLILPPSAKGKNLCRGFKGLGLRVPNHAGLLRVLTYLKKPMACTSANIHGEPVITDETILTKTFDNKVDYILTDGNLSAVASSVVDMVAEPALLREGAIFKKELEQTLHVLLK